MKNSSLISYFIFYLRYGNIKDISFIKLKAKIKENEMLEFENSDEKAYKSMNFVGVVNVTLGIVIVVVAAVCGAFIIAGGGRLLKDKKGITF